MSILKQLKMSLRFAILMGCVIVGFGVYGGWSFKTLDEIKVNGPIYQRVVLGKDLVADILPPPAYIIESYLVSLQLFSADQAQQNQLSSRLKTLKAEYDARHQFWLQQQLPAEMRTMLLEEAHRHSLEFYRLAFEVFLPALAAGQRDEAERVLQAMRQAYEQHRKAVDQVVVMANQRVADNEDQARQTIQHDLMLLLGVWLLTIVLTLTLATWIFRSISRPLAVLNKTINLIHDRNDFTLRVAIDSQDEIGQAASAFNGLIGDIQQNLQGLMGHANELTAQAHALSASAQQVAASSYSQSDAASLIAENIEQLNHGIHNVTHGAQQAFSLSRQSGDLSNHGGDIIQKAAHSMLQIAHTVQNTASSIQALEQQSQQISTVVQVIKDVADQINLLALNAAIEAARAGDQGRGFAVVADEVRNLAKRTTKATEEISQMIGDIQHSTATAFGVMAEAVEKADEGAVIAGQAGGAIDQIKASSAHVVNVVDDISKNLEHQNQASGAIGNHIEQVALMAEDNKAMAENSAHGAIQLEKLAEQMRATVNQFRL